MSKNRRPRKVEARQALRAATYWTPNPAAPKQTESRYNKPGSSKPKHSLGKVK